MDGAPLELGGRVCDKTASTGTVRYIGEINGSEGTWVGVEWDDCTRGKHDGTYLGAKYFDCKAGAGSFVRPTNLVTGHPFTTAIVQKYSPDYRPHIRVHCTQVTQQDSETGSFPQLRNVDMTGGKICSATCGIDIRTLCPNITQLSLASNLLHKWSEVFTIVQSLPNLEWLKLNDNKFTEIEPTLSIPPQPALKSIILNNTNCNWRDINFICTVFPNVQELHIGRLELSTVEFTTKMESVSVLHVGRNNLSSWDEVHKLSEALPNLRALYIHENNLSDASFGDQAKLISSLQVISLDDNPINEYSSLEQLARLLPNVREFSCNIAKDDSSISQDERRRMIIAEMPSLQKVNRSRVSMAERETAERFYVRHYADKPNPPPSYLRLREKHGDLKPLVDIRFETFQTIHSAKVYFEEQEIEGYAGDLSLMLWEFLDSVAERLGEKATSLEAFHKSPYTFEAMKFPERKLHAYRILDGDTIHVFRRKQPARKDGARPRPKPAPKPCFMPGPAPTCDPLASLLSEYAKVDQLVGQMAGQKKEDLQ